LLTLNETDTMAMIQLTYFSKPVFEKASDLMPMVKAVLDVAIPANVSRNITGYLMFDKDWFVQVLEGEEADVTRLYEKISLDRRHKDVQLKSKRKATNRDLAGWSMGAVLKSVETQEVLLKHGIGSSLNPLNMTHDQIVAVAQDLSRRQRATSQAQQRAA
jgi:Sensors of blue-light using FAD